MKCSSWLRCVLTPQKEAGLWAAYWAEPWEMHGEDLGREALVAWPFK